MDAEAACWSVEAAEAAVLAVARATLHVAAASLEARGGCGGASSSSWAGRGAGRSALRVAFHVFDSVGGVQGAQKVAEGDPRRSRTLVGRIGGRRGFHELDRGALSDLREVLVGCAARAEAARSRGAPGEVPRGGEVTPREADGAGGGRAPPRSPASRLWQNPTLLALSTALNDFDWASIDLREREGEGEGEEGDEDEEEDEEEALGGAEGDDSPVGVVPHGGGGVGSVARRASLRRGAAVVVVGGLDASCRGVAYDCVGPRGGGGSVEERITNVTSTLESLGASYRARGVALKWIDLGALGGPGQSPGQRVALANAVKNVLLASCVDRLDGGLIGARWLPLPASNVLPPAEDFFRASGAGEPGEPGEPGAADPADALPCALALPGGASLSVFLKPALLLGSSGTGRGGGGMAVALTKARAQDLRRTLAVPSALASRGAVEIYYVRHSGLMGWLRARGVSLEGLVDARRECVVAALSPDVGVLLVEGEIGAECLTWAAADARCAHSEDKPESGLRPAAMLEAVMHMEELGVQSAGGVDGDGAVWTSMPEAAFAEPWFLSYARPCRRKLRSEGSLAGVLAGITRQPAGKGAPPSSSLEEGSMETDKPPAEGNGDIAEQDAAYAEYLAWKRSLAGGERGDAHHCDGNAPHTSSAADDVVRPAALEDTAAMPRLAASPADASLAADALKSTYESVVKADRDEQAVLLPDLDIPVELVHRHVGQSLRFLAQSFEDASRALPLGAQDALAVATESPSELRARFRQSYMSASRIKEKMITYQVQVCLRLEALRWEALHVGGGLKARWARAASDEVTTLLDGVSLISPTGVQSLLDDVLVPRYCDALPSLIRNAYQDLELQPGKDVSPANVTALGSSGAFSGDEDEREDAEADAAWWDSDSAREVTSGSADWESAGHSSQPSSSQPRGALNRQASGPPLPVSSSQEDAAPGASVGGPMKGAAKAWYRAPSQVNLLRNRSVGITVTLQKGATREQLNTTAARLKVEGVRGTGAGSTKKRPAASTSAHRSRLPAPRDGPASHGPKGPSKRTRRSLDLDLPAAERAGQQQPQGRQQSPAARHPSAAPLQLHRAPGAAAALLQSGASAPAVGTIGAFGTMARVGRVAAQAAPAAGAASSIPGRISAAPPAFTSNALRGLSALGGGKVRAPPPSVMRPKALNRLLSRSSVPLARPKAADKPSSSAIQAADSAAASPPKKSVMRRLI